MSGYPSVISPLLHGPAAYRERAQRLRAMAEDFAAREWRDIFLRLAKSYEEHANTAEDDLRRAS